MDFFCCMKDVPLTFGNISKKILQVVLKYNARKIAIIFDRYHTSIKDNEHALRGTSEIRDFHVSGEEQIRRTDFSKELHKIKFKEALIKFLIIYWENDEMASFFSTKTIQLNLVFVTI